MTHVQLVEDERGDLADVLYYCSQTCADADNAPQPSYWPGGMETDYCTFCHVCEAVVQHGITECNCDD